MCNNEENLIIQSDFACIGDVAKHCVIDKLCIAISEAQEEDLSELFCDYWADIMAIINEVETYDALYALYLIELAECELDPECDTPPVAPDIPEDYELKKNLVCGGEFAGCNDRTKTHKGVKRIIVYYAYSRYLIINGFSDTASGNVKKTNEFSLPTPLKELQNFADKYRTMGYGAYKKTLSFLCKNKEVFTWFDSGKCEGCGCGGDCDKSTKSKGYGFSTSKISKELPSTNYFNLRDRYGNL